MPSDACPQFGDRSASKKARKPGITPAEADQIIAALRASNKSDEAVARIADTHSLSSLTIRKIAVKRGVRMAA